MTDFKESIEKVMTNIHPDAKLDSAALDYINNFLSKLTSSIMGEIQFLLETFDEAGSGGIVDVREIQFAVRSVFLKAPNLTRLATVRALKAVLKDGKDSVSFVINYDINESAKIYFSAILEFICSEIAELSGNTASSNKNFEVNDENVKRSIEADGELNYLACVIGLAPKVPTKSPKVPTKSPKVPTKSTKSPKVPTKSPKVPTKSSKVPTKSPKVPTKSPKVPTKSPKVPTKSPKTKSKKVSRRKSRKSKKVSRRKSRKSKKVSRRKSRKSRKSKKVSRRKSRKSKKVSRRKLRKSKKVSK